MPISSRLSIGNIRQAVAQERRACIKSGGLKALEGTREIFFTGAPRKAIYTDMGESELDRFNRISLAIKSLALPKNTLFADLGSGLSEICCLVAEDFDHIVGFELATKIASASRRVIASLGITNIVIKEEDFTVETTDLTKFGLLYIFQPFVQNFCEIVAPKMAGLRPGTIVLPSINDEFLAEIFPLDLFNRIPFENSQLRHTAAYQHK